MDQDRTETDVAEAFSRHEFASIYQHLAPEVVWDNVGGDQYHGREAIIAACDDAARYFATVDSDVTLQRTVAAHHVVVVEAIGRYRGTDSESTVASCDVYAFADGYLVAIKSYNVETS